VSMVDNSSFDDQLNYLVSNFKKDHRNKVSIDETLLLLGIKEELGLILTGTELATLINQYQSDDLDSDQMETYDAATIVCGQVASRCFSEDGDDMDYELDWNEDDAGHVFAIIRPMI